VHRIRKEIRELGFSAFRGIANRPLINVWATVNEDPDDDEPYNKHVQLDLSSRIIILSLEPLAEAHRNPSQCPGNHDAE
jgi:hypothetical protein